MSTRFTPGLLALLGLWVALPEVCNGQASVRTDFTAPATVEANFTTPWDAVETMIRAAKAKDLQTLTDCFADRIPEAFEPYREGNATRRELDTLAEWAWDAEVIDVQMEGAKDAQVTVRYHPKLRPWTMQLVRVGGGWKIGGR